VCSLAGSNFAFSLGGTPVLAPAFFSSRIEVGTPVAME